MSERQIWEYERTRQTAERINCSESYLNKLRMTGDGPPFLKIGKSVRYYWPDVQKWLDARVRQSTSQAG